MEAECNAVAMGRKRKEEIMQPILIKMRECFEKASAEALKLDAAIARHFTRIGADNNNSNTIQQNFSKCGSCQGFLSLKELTGARNNHHHNRGRNNRSNNTRSNPKLLQCSSCSVGYRLPAKGIPTPFVQNSEAKLCPICQFQVIKISQGDGYTGNGYHVCPKCFNDAPIEYGGAATSGEFRCFNCTHSTCTLASGTRGGDVEVFPCPFCAGSNAGKITLQKNSRGYILSCSNRCEYKIWLPKAASSVGVAEPPLSTEAQNDTSASTALRPTNNAISNNDQQNAIVCNRCSNPNRTVRLLSFRWNPNKVPPGIPIQQVACILCDEGLKSDFQIMIPQLNQVRIHRGRQQQQQRRHSSSRERTPPPSSSYSSTNSYGGNHSSGGGSRGRGRGGTTSYNNNSSRSRSRDRIFPNSNGGNNDITNYNNYSGGGGRGGRTNFSNTNNNSTSSEVRCYKCGQIGHYASRCPN